MVRLSVATALASVLAVSAVSTQKQEPPPGGEPKAFKLPAKKSFQLDNGLGATLVPYGTLPKVTVSVIVRSGNLNEGADETWLADLTADLMKEGTATRGAEALASEVAAMGGELTISTGLDETTVASDALSENAGGLVRLLADVVRHSAFPASELGRLQKDMVRNLSIAKSQAQPLAEERFMELLYPNHPYGRVFPTEEMIGSYDIERVKTFYQTNFGAQRTHVYVAGMFDEGDVEEAIRESFGDWGRGQEPLIKPPKPVTKRVVHLINRPGAPQSTLRIGLPVVDPSHEDYMALQVTNALLGGSFGSRITSNIREDKGYTYSPSSAVGVRYRAAHWVESADVTTADTGAAMREIFNEIQRLQEEAPSANELEGIQNYVAGIFVLRNSSREGVIGQLAFLGLHGLPDAYLTTYVKNVYAVTPTDVQRIAKDYLQDPTMTIVVVGDRAQIREQLTPFGQVVEQ
ncbi:MAG: insulinase family protein [Luteitalea sp.]|nr:insulinase family protein [Luteitalea sp.]